MKKTFQPPIDKGSKFEGTRGLRAYIFIVTCVIGLIQLSACKKFVDAGLPKTSLLTSSVFNDSRTANAASLGMFTKLASISFDPSRLPGLSSDELINYSNTGNQIQVYTNNMLPTTQVSIWNDFYNCIYQANAILEALPNAQLSASLKAQLEGEARFTRALSHFYLVNFYGSVPIVSSTDYRVNSLLSKSSTNDVYKSIINDLVIAKGLLNENFVNADGLTTTNERLRPSKYAASALLARVYLYNSQYAQAEQESSYVINNPAFALESDLKKVFLTTSKEAIFQVTQGAPLNTWFSDNYRLTSNPSSVALNPSLVNLFEPGDLRKTSWVGTYSSYYFANKYNASQYSGTQTEYVVVLRLAEQYLIRAESRIKQDKLVDGIDDINTVRRRSRQAPTGAIPDPLPNLSPNLSQSAALQAIEKERFLELFLEWGDRWLDLKRTGRIDAVMTQVAPSKNSTWEPYKKLYPIPELEIRNNPNMVQNTGY